MTGPTPDRPQLPSWMRTVVLWIVLVVLIVLAACALLLALAFTFAAMRWVLSGVTS